jgi:predicted ATPase with chaperone activity
MDRFDLRLEVPPVSYRDLEMPAGGETSAVIARRVADARACRLRGSRNWARRRASTPMPKARF